MMKKEGLLVLKTSEIELELSPQAIFHEESKRIDDATSQTSAQEPPKYSQEEALFWSSPGHFLTDEVSQ